ncbi:MAG TPA: HAMP domain-containing sensor histidine kinase [Caldilineaceae bacterium]|nr:HAMP domain-containing sensor histidine kinase [Caldilineaceae bacterium]
MTEDDGQAEQQNGEGDGQHDSGGSYRLISVPVPLSGQTAAYLQVARSMEPIDEALNALLVLLLFSGPIVMLLALAGGYWLAGRTLAPIERLRQEAAAISASTVEQRESLSNHLPDDEVGRLARTFDDMLTRLATSFQRQRRFTADASHELRTPLSILRGEVDVALEKPRSPAIYVETLHSIQAEVERMSRLVSDLLVLSRRDNDQLVLQKASVDISELLRNLTAQVSEQNEAEGMSFTSDLPARLLLCADLDRLIQLFLNLLDNVMAHAPGSQVSITASGSGNWVHVQVADTGPGIPPEHLPHIFERFYRVDPARSRARGGSGLGLAIAKEIALAHGGDIDVSSPAGGGTVFVVNLPLAADECSPQGREIQG